MYIACKSVVPNRGLLALTMTSGAVWDDALCFHMPAFAIC